MDTRIKTNTSQKRSEARRISEQGKDPFLYCISVCVGSDVGHMHLTRVTLEKLQRVLDWTGLLRFTARSRLRRLRERENLWEQGRIWTGLDSGLA